MAIPAETNRPLSFGNDIEQEFGQPVGRNLGAFRISQTVGDMTNLPLDEGIGQVSDNGTDNSIRFSQFRGKRLNIVVLYNENEQRAEGGHQRYKSTKPGSKVIISPDSEQESPTDGKGSKIILHVAGAVTLSSNKNKSHPTDNTGQHRCALRSGSPEEWDETEPPVIHINIGPAAVVSGAGGDGGAGGDSGTLGGRGEDGEDGSSAIGIACPVEKITIQEGARVIAGAGGGGGGGAGAGELDKASSNERVGGAGGGGGAGLPAGVGGAANLDGGGIDTVPQNGSNGSGNINGEGGNGGFGGKNNEGSSDNTPSAQSGGGGGGGAISVNQVGEGGGSDGNLGESAKINDFTMRWSGTFVDPGPPPTKDPNGSETRTGQGGGASFDWNENSSDNYALRDATLGWTATTNSPITENNVEMIHSVTGSGSGFRVDIKYSPYQMNEDNNTTNFQTKVEITAIRDKGGGYSVGDALTTEYWTANAEAPDGTEATTRIINVSEIVQGSDTNGTGGDGSIIDTSQNSGKGGSGGDGEGEGSGQEKGSGGEGGDGGYAIITKNVPLPTIEGNFIGRAFKGDSEIAI